MNPGLPAFHFGAPILGLAASLSLPMSHKGYSRTIKYPEDSSEVVVTQDPRSPNTDTYPLVVEDPGKAPDQGGKSRDQSSGGRLTSASFQRPCCQRLAFYSTQVFMHTYYVLDMGKVSLPAFGSVPKAQWGPSPCGISSTQHLC